MTFLTRALRPSNPAHGFAVGTAEHPSRTSHAAGTAKNTRRATRLCGPGRGMWWAQSKTVRLHDHHSGLTEADRGRVIVAGLRGGDE